MDTIELYHVHNDTLFGHFRIESFHSKWFFDKETLKIYLKDCKDNRDEITIITAVVPSGDIYDCGQHITNKTVNEILPQVGECKIIKALWDRDDTYQYFMKCPLNYYGLSSVFQGNYSKLKHEFNIHVEV